MEFEHCFVAYIHFNWDTHLKILSDYADRKNKNFSDVLDSVESQIGRLKYVDEVCFNHMSWIKVDFETDSLKAVNNRLKVLKLKLERIFLKYERVSTVTIR